MMQRHFPHLNPRPAGTGPFFDYVLSAMLHEHRIAESRQTSLEQRWEGEGGRTRECAPGGRS